MNASKVSVVICTRNRPEVLRACLVSVAESETQPKEVVVVDQSDGEDTMAVVKGLTAMFPVPLRYLRLESIGHTKARNAGIKASHGEIVAFTDDDCTVDRYWAETLAREFTDPSIYCVCGRTMPANHEDRPRQALLSTLEHKRRKVLKGKHNPIMVGRGNNMAFRKSNLLELGCFHEQVGVGTPLFAGDDTDVFYRILETGATLVYTPDAIVLHAQPDDWPAVIQRKRGYSLSAAAVVATRLRYGDPYAAALLIGKVFYEFGYLFCGGLLRADRRIAAVGWHSLVGSLSGLKYLLDGKFCDGMRQLSAMARESRSAEAKGSKAAPETMPADTKI